MPGPRGSHLRYPDATHPVAGAGWWCGESPWFVFIAIPATTHPHVELMWNLKKRQVKNVEHVLHQALSQQDMRLSNKNQD